jgi:hypothetical protein
MTDLPKDLRIPNTSELANFDAPVGTRMWIETSACFYEAIPYDIAEPTDLAGAADLSRVAWRRTRKLGDLVSGTTVLSTNAATACGSILFKSATDCMIPGGLAASSHYHATVKMRAVIWETADPHNIGSMDYTSDVLITTDSSKVPTCLLVGTPAADVTRLPAAHSGAACIFAPATGGLGMTATRATDLASTCTAEWEIIGRITKQG